MQPRFQLTENILDSTDAGIIVVDAGLHVQVWNRWLEKVSGIPAKQALSRPLYEIFPQLEDSRLIKAISACVNGGMASTLSTTLNAHPMPLYSNEVDRARGNLMFQQIVIKPIVAEEAESMAMVQILDVTGSVHREQKLREQSGLMQSLMTEISSREVQVRTVLENTLDGIITITESGMVREFNPAAEKIFGYQKDEILGSSINRLIPAAMSQYQNTEKIEDIANTLSLVLGSTRELPAKRKDGSSFMLELSLNEMRLHGERLYVGSMRDVTERTQAEQLIRHMAQHDALTDLPNRTLFKDRLESAMALAQRHDQLVAVMFLDLDRFKTINDTMGHHTGDALLTEVAKRLKSITRNTDTVARLGGDEFAIIQTEINHADGVVSLAEKVIAAVAKTYNYDGNDINTSTSIGITLYPTDKGDADQLLQNADMAMYRAKRAGRNNFQFYSNEMHEEIQHTANMEKDIRRALVSDEFVLFYQPQIDLRTGKVVGVEALVRWMHPERGLIPPDEFIPVAEDSGLILPLGHLVLVQACRWAKNWQDTGNEAIRVAVNLSAVQFNDPGLVEDIANTLKQTKLSPEYLELELTESFLMENAGTTINTLKQLHDLDLELAIDDFGTGYSSLAYLKRFPVNKIKIDRSFVNDISTDNEDAVIVQSVISLGHSLGLKVIAEGLETEEQLAFLQLHGCDEVQGYYYGKPMPAEEFIEFMKQPVRIPSRMSAIRPMNKSRLLG